MQKLVLTVCAAVMAGVLQVGVSGCPNQQLIKVFDETAFLGPWYEFGMYASFSQIFERCMVHDFIATGSNGIINVESTYVNDNTVYTRYGKLKKAVPGALNSNYSITYDKDGFAGKETEETKANYQIIVTDYTSYAIVWRCSSFIFNFEHALVLTRVAEPDEGLVDEIRTQIGRRDLSWLLLSRTTQKCTKKTNEE